MQLRIFQFILCIFLSGCCMGGTAQEEAISYPRRSSIHNNLSANAAHQKCDEEVNQSLELWRAQCINQRNDFIGLAPPNARMALFISPLDANQRKWYCEELIQTPLPNANSFQNLNTSLKYPLMRLKQTCMRDLGFAPIIRNTRECRPSFFGPF